MSREPLKDDQSVQILQQIEDIQSQDIQQSQDVQHPHDLPETQEISFSASDLPNVIIEDGMAANFVAFNDEDGIIQVKFNFGLPYC